MKRFTTILATTAFFGAMAFAADEKPAAGAPDAAKGEKKKHNPEEIFGKLDANADKKVSLDEFKAGPMGKKDPAKAEEIFKKKDKDSDGSLSLEEFSAHGPKGEKKPK